MLVNQLASLNEGDIGVITHIEDEPALVYAQLVALDLYPGTKVYVLDVTDDRITFAANGEECVLSPLFAANVTIELLGEEEPMEEKYSVLSSLQLGDKAEIISISSKCRGQERRRLMDLGVIPGVTVLAELQNTFGDPTAYRVMGATIALRDNLADKIYIRKLNGSHE